MMGISYYFSKAIKFLHLPAIKNSKIHHTSKVSSATHLVNTTIDRYSFIGSNCTVIESEIGSFCSIADNVIIGGAAHPISWVSTSPVFHNGKNILKKNFSIHPFQTTKKTVVGNDVWIGSNCLIKGGVSIASGSVIGMGSIVTKDVGPYEIWAGNPAKMIKKRFDETTIKNLINIEWWNWNDSDLKSNAQFMKNTSEFIKLHTRKKVEK